MSDDLLSFAVVEEVQVPTVPCERCGGTGQRPDDPKVGNLMRQRREKTGISMREVSRRLKFSAAYVCDLELGRRAWSQPLVTRYLEAIR